MDWNMMGGVMSAGVFIWWILGIALIVLVVAGIVLLARRLGREGSYQKPGRSAIAELELRYARGEVDRETYVAIRRDLEANDI